MSAKTILAKIKHPDVLCLALIVLTITAFHFKIIQGRAVFPFDYEGYHYPLLHFIGHEFLNGRLPVYDPYIYSGLPFLLNTQAALFYPVHLVYLGALALFRVETTQYLINLLGVFHFVLGGIFFFYLARHYGIRRSLSVVGSILYSLNGHILAQSQHLGLIETFAWLPLLCLLSLKFLQKPEIRIAASIAIVGALLALIGFLPMVIATVFVLGIFVCAKLFSDLACFGRKLTGLLFAAVIAVCLTAVITIPLITADQPMQELGIHGHMPVSFLKTLLWPNVFEMFDFPKYTGPGDPTMSYLYAGLMIPFFILLGLFIAGKKAIELPLAFLFSLAIGFSPILYFSGIYSYSRFFALLRPENFLYFAALFGVLLSLLAIEFFAAKSWVITVLITIQAAMTVALMAGRSLSKHDLHVVAATAIVSLFSLLFLFFKSNSTVLISILAAGHLFAVNLNCPLWAMRNKPDSITPQTIEFNNEDLLRLLKQPAEPHRVAIDHQYLGGYWNGSWRIWRIESIGGFEPFRSQKYLDTVVQELSDWQTDRLFNVARLDSPLLNLLNVRYLVGRSDHPPNPLTSQWRKVHEGFWEVYENRGFHSRYTVVPFDSVSINPTARTANYLPGTDRAGRIDSIAKEPGYAKFSMSVETPRAFLFIGERNYRGWDITVDGRRVEPMTVNELFMGIPVIQGQHRVTLQFRVPHRNLIILLTALGLCLVVAGFCATASGYRSLAIGKIPV